MGAARLFAVNRDLQSVFGQEGRTSVSHGVLALQTNVAEEQQAYPARAQCWQTLWTTKSSCQAHVSVVQVARLLVPQHVQRNYAAVRHNGVSVAAILL